MTTLRGNGWLSEAPINLVPREWLKIRGRAELAKCLFLPASPFARKASRSTQPLDADTLVDVHVGDEARADWRRGERRPTPVRSTADREYVRRVAPLRHARVFQMPLPLAEADARRAADVMPRLPVAEPWSSPWVLGLLLVLAPPIGVAALWTSPRYDRDARWALTITSCVFMAFAAVVALTLR